MSDYYQFVQDLANQNKTSGPEQSEALIQYTQLSAKRMKRWMKTAQISESVAEKIRAIKEPQNWTVLTESWCGDAAHTFMFLKKLAELNDKITFEWKLRDENLALMDQYLTNGGRSIPKLIVKDAQGKDLFNWGPRPDFIQEAYLRMKSDGTPAEDAKIELQHLYNTDKGETIQKEIGDLIEKLA